MLYNKIFFNKVFSDERMERYFIKYPSDENRAIRHYQCNLELSEAMYVSISVFEVALRNALCRELKMMTGREDWYAIFTTTPGLSNLNKYITYASKHIVNRHEQLSSSKIIAELTLGFWVSLLNSEYELILWKDLRRAFPFMPKSNRQRKNVSAPLNRLRAFRNRIFHNEPICWNINTVRQIHSELIEVLGWMNRDIPNWLASFDRFDDISNRVCTKLGW